MQNVNKLLLRKSVITFIIIAMSSLLSLSFHLNFCAGKGKCNTKGLINCIFIY